MRRIPCTTSPNCPRGYTYGDPEYDSGQTLGLLVAVTEKRTREEIDRLSSCVSQSKIGRATAIAVIMFVLVLVGSAALLRTMRNREEG